jgi:hypothetical protein
VYETKQFLFAMMPILLLSGCASCKYLVDTKLIAFDDDIAKGKAIGPIRVEDGA